MKSFREIPQKYHPRGFKILHEDRDIIIGHKSAGYLTVSALWNKDTTIHAALNRYIRKGNLKSRKCVFVVHRLDQETSGVLLFAKTPEAQKFLKDNWKNTQKVYFAVVHGHLKLKAGTFSSYLEEDDDYVVRSVKDSPRGKLSHTAYEVVQENEKYSLLKVNLLTGRKNQIRVHLAEAGHPVVGDEKYGKGRAASLALHAQSLTIIHPFTLKPLTIEVDVPEFFKKLMM